MYQYSASYIKATGGSEQIDLPVVNMEVRAEPITPEGGTAQEDYDQRIWFQEPTFRLMIELEWPYERTDFAPSFQDSLRDLIAQYMAGNGPLDFHVKYTGSTTQYEPNQYDSDYICPNMIPDMSQEDAGLLFSERAREKDRSLTLKSQSSKLTWADVQFTFD